MSLSSELDLPAIFKAAYESCGLRPTVVDPYAELLQSYTEPPRVYHTFDGHIVDCINLALTYKLPSPGVLALFYHDAVCVPGGQLNEEASFDLLTTHFEHDEARIRGMHSMWDLLESCILATKHKKPPARGLEAMVVDIDLSILGRTESVFNDYDIAIRKEYSFASDEEFEAGRVAFLAELLRREHIYYTSWFQHRYEERARINLGERVTRAARAARAKVEDWNRLPTGTPKFMVVRVDNYDDEGPRGTERVVTQMLLHEDAEVIAARLNADPKKLDYDYYMVKPSYYKLFVFKGY